MAVVALVVSDIVGSTGLWAAHEGAMAADLAVHDELVRDVVSGHRGSVFKHTGDGAMAAFEDPFAALDAAVALQRRVTSSAWETPGGIRVRVAVHCGPVIARDGDLFGTPVNRAARLLGVCPAGAVVVSSVAAGLVADRLLSGVQLQPVGQVHLRGFAGPEDVHAVVADGVAAVDRLDGDTGPVSSPSLPAVDDAFVGRLDELAAVWGLLGAHHVVSIVGVGGMGKTRLALEAAVGASREFPAGVHWCDLAAATSAEAVVPVVLDAVGARQEAGRPPVESILTRLRGGRCLVVLDNCEHVLAAARDLVTRIRSGAPDVRLLVTSREALGVRGEHLVPLSSLPMPEAVELFVGRARDAGIDLDPDQQPVIERICQRLDGIPLAVELAAARCRSLDPGEIDQRLDDRFRLLRSGRPGVERHRTLQAAVGWSYDLLDDTERDVFDRMAVFADGSLLDGIAAVTGLDDYDALDVIDRLVARSMLTATSTELGTRYRQLETLRQYAEDRLTDRSLLRDTRDRHLTWAVTLATWIGGQRDTPNGGRAFRRFVHEVDNFRVAVAHATTTGQRRRAYDLLGPIAPSAWRRMVLDVLAWIDPYDDPDLWTPARADVAGLHGVLGLFSGDTTASARTISAVPQHLRTREPAAWATMFDLAWVRHDLDAAQQLAADVQRVDPAARVLEVFSITVRQSLDTLTPAEQAQLLADVVVAVDRCRPQGDTILLAAALAVAANAFSNAGQPERALEVALEALDLAEADGAHLTADTARINIANSLGATVANTHDGPERRRAAAHIRQAITGIQERGNRLLPVFMLQSAAVVVRDTDPATAYLLSRTAMSEFRGPLHTQAPPDRLDPTTIATLEARASAMSHHDAIAIALAALDRYLSTAEQ